MAAPNPNIKGPGIMFVNSRISRKDILDEQTYFKWYDEDHIAEIVSTEGMKDAFRYINADERASKPYLAFYPMADLAFTQGDRFRRIRFKSDMLPGTGIIYDMADVDVRYLGLVGQTERKGPKKGTLCEAGDKMRG